MIQKIFVAVLFILQVSSSLGLQCSVSVDVVGGLAQCTSSCSAGATQDTVWEHGVAYHRMAPSNGTSDGALVRVAYTSGGGVSCGVVEREATSGDLEKSQNDMNHCIAEGTQPTTTQPPTSQPPTTQPPTTQPPTTQPPTTQPSTTQPPTTQPPTTRPPTTQPPTTQPPTTQPPTTQPPTTQPPTTKPTTTTTPAPIDCDTEIVVHHRSEDEWTTPNYPENYPDGVICTLTVTIPASMPMGLATVTMVGPSVIAPVSGCGVDHLLYTSSQGRQARYCGPLSGALTTEMTLMDAPKSFTFTFTSSSADGGLTDMGLKLRITGIDQMMG